MRVGIVNVSGYAGSELAGLLWRHPDAEIVSVTGRSAAGKRLPEVLPHLWQIDLPVTKSIDVSVDVAFSALPSGASAAVLAPIVRDGARGIDIAADFRLHSPAAFEEAYGAEHPAPELLRDAVYGLPELHREAIKTASLVANPGCYPEASLLALAPAGERRTRSGRHRYRRQVGHLGRRTRRPGGEHDGPLRRGQRERHRLRAGGPRPPGRDRPGNRRAPGGGQRPRDLRPAPASR